MKYIKEYKDYKDIDPFDEEDWGEIDNNKNKIFNDKIALYIDDEDNKLVRLKYDQIIEEVIYYFQTYLVEEDINLNNNVIGFNINYSKYFEPLTLLEFRNEFIYNSRFVESVFFHWNGKIEIELDDEFIYEF